MPPKHGDRVGDPLDLGGFPSGLTQGKIISKSRHGGAARFGYSI